MCSENSPSVFVRDTNYAFVCHSERDGWSSVRQWNSKQKAPLQVPLCSRESEAGRLGNLTETTPSQGMTLHAAFKYGSETYCFTFRDYIVIREASKICINANNTRKSHCPSQKRLYDQARLKCLVFTRYLGYAHSPCLYRTTSISAGFSASDA